MAKKGDDYCVILALLLFLLPREPAFDMTPCEPGPKQIQLMELSKAGPQLQSLQNPRLEWDYLNAPGPIWFEVWSSTNLVNWSQFATTIKTNPGTHSIPIQFTNTARFFTVRAVNEAGPGPWAQ